MAAEIDKQSRCAKIQSDLPWPRELFSDMLSGLEEGGGNYGARASNKTKTRCYLHTNTDSRRPPNLDSVSMV